MTPIATLRSSRQLQTGVRSYERSRRIARVLFCMLALFFLLTKGA